MTRLEIETADKLGGEARVMILQRLGGGGEINVIAENLLPLHDIQELNEKARFTKINVQGVPLFRRDLIRRQEAVGGRMISQRQELGEMGGAAITAA